MEQGKHKVKVTGAFVGGSEGKSPYIGIEFTNDAGQSIVNRMYLTGKEITGSGKNAGKKLKTVSIETLMKCGFKGRDLDALDSYDSIEEVFSEVKGGIEITVFEEEYEGKTRTKVQYVNFGFEGKEEKLDRAEIKKVSSKFNLAGDIARMLQEMKGNYATKKEPASESSFSDDDIPF